MVALSGANQGQPFIALIANADEADTLRPNTTLAPGVRTIGTALQAPAEAPSLMSGFIGSNSRSKTVTMISVHIGRLQRHDIRGYNNSGRDENLGPAPNDGSGIGFDYFEKILLDPSVIELGNVVSDQIFNILITNTFRKTNQTLTSIVNNAGDGLTISNITPPAAIVALDSKTAILTVSTSGPPIISGTIDFVTTVRTAQLLITGTRIIIFPYFPHGGIKEKLQWLTDIIRTADGTEQRSALRTVPRLSTEVEYLIDNRADINSIRNLLVDWTSRVFGVPLWWDERALSADAAAAASTVFLSVDPTTGTGGVEFADFRVGGLAMVIEELADGSRQLDVLEVLTINLSPNSLTFTAPLNFSYNAGRASVLPVVAGVLAEPMSQTTNQDGNSGKFMAQFDFLDNDDSMVPNLEVGMYPELLDFDNVPQLILTDKNYLEGRTLSESYGLKLQRSDFDTGEFSQLTQEVRAKVSTPHSWVVETAAFLWQVKSLLKELRGRWRAVWVPTWRDDFTLISNMGTSSAFIEVVSTEFSKFAKGASPYSGVRIRKNDGSVSYHRITSATIVDTTTDRITFTPNTTFAMTIAETEQIDLMILARQSNDTITINHLWGDGIGTEIDSLISGGFVGDVQENA